MLYTIAPLTVKSVECYESYKEIIRVDIKQSLKERERGRREYIVSITWLQSHLWLEISHSGGGPVSQSILWSHRSFYSSIFQMKTSSLLICSWAIFANNISHIA
jgi:hypothetical protein